MTSFPQGSRVMVRDERGDMASGLVEGFVMRDRTGCAVKVPVRMADSALVWVGVSNIIIDDTQEIAA